LAAGSLHVAAVAGGATPIGTTIPIAAADAIHTETIRRIADMSHLSQRAGRRVRASAVANVTIVIYRTSVVGDAKMDMHP
jgi:hypothetical protein